MKKKCYVVIPSKGGEMYAINWAMICIAQWKNNAPKKFIS